MIYLSSFKEVDDVIELNLLRGGRQAADAHLDRVSIGMTSLIERLGTSHRAFGSNHLVIDPDTASWAVLNDSEWEVYRHPAVSFRDLCGAFAGYSPTALERFIRTLYKRGLVSVDRHCPYSRDLYTGHPPHRDALLVELLVAETCNLRCLYCQSVASGKMDLMPLDVAQAAIDHALKLPHEFVIVEISGGEPLLNFSVLSQIVCYVEAKFTDSDKRMLLNIVTNGTLITPDIARFIKEHQIRLTLSLDGPGDLQGRSRPLPGGRSSWRIQERGISVLQDHGIPFNVVTTVNRKNHTRAPEIVCFLAELGVRSAKMNPVIRVGRASAGDGIAVSPAEYLAFMKSALKTIVTQNLSLREAILCEMVNRLITRFRDYRCMRGCCGAGDSYFVIDPRGKVFPCAAMTGFDHMRLGDVRDPAKGLADMANGNTLVERLNTRRLADIQPCGNCEWRAFCTAGCGVEVLRDANAAVITAHDANCEFYLGMYPHLIEELAGDSDVMRRFVESESFAYGPAWVTNEEFLV
jgi:uncharacterized protein